MEPNKKKTPPPALKTFEITLRGKEETIVTVKGDHLYITARGDLTIVGRGTDTNFYGSTKCVFAVHTGGWKTAKQITDAGTS